MMDGGGMLRERVITWVQSGQGIHQPECLSGAFHLGVAVTQPRLLDVIPVNRVLIL